MSPLDLRFVEQHRYRPFEVVSSRFVQHSRQAVGDCSELTHSGVSPPAPFAAVEVDVLRPGGEIVAGLGEPDGDHVVATWSAATRTVAVEVCVEGRTTIVGRRRVRLPDRFTLGFAVCERQVTVLARVERPGSGDGTAWRPLLTERAGVAALLDLRRPEVLGRLGHLWGVRDGSAELGDVRAGLFGMTGLRDPHLVQHADGRPYVRDGLAYLTWSCAGLGFFAQAHWGVFTLDLADPTRLEQVAQLYSHRDGLLLGDHAGQLVRDGDRWLVATSSWGDFTARPRSPDDRIHVRHLTTTDDLLTGVHLLRTERTPLPSEAGCWDPGFTRIDGRWHVGFVESPSQHPFAFHPALASTAAGDPWHGLSRVGAAEDLAQCEGPVLAHVGDRWWMLASDGDARDYPVFDLAMTRVGRLDAPYPSNIPHPQLLPREDGSWLLVSFDGTPPGRRGWRRLGYGGHGDVVVMGQQVVRSAPPAPAPGLACDG